MPLTPTPSPPRRGKINNPFFVFLVSLCKIFLFKQQSCWFIGLGKLSRLIPTSLKRLVYRLPWLANWLRQRVNRSIGQRLQWVEITAGGLRGLSLYLDLTQEKDYWLGVYEPELQMAIQELVHAGQVAYDIGANVGYITLMLARRVGPQGKVIALEPFPQNVQRLRQNIAANAHLAPIEVVAAAVVETNRSVPFWVGLSDDTGRVGDPSLEEPTPRESILVEGVALDELVYKQGYPKPDVVKIDIEGGEVLALQGMKRLLHEAHPLLLLETHNRACTETACTLLTQAGYRISRMQKGYPALNCQQELPRRVYLVAFPPK
ncbi:MAG: FkbM family methyltransferase [Anaerolineales bacterium]|nr:FkbM family methyltransferase [Anaerolineales bacterium]